MNTSTALKPSRNYQKSDLKPGTGISYRYVLDNFEELFQFLELLTEDTSKVTKNHRYAQLKALFNFVIMNYEPDLRNPLDTPLMRKSFRLSKSKNREIISKELMDEVIFTSKSLRDRLMLELQCRCGARIGEVLAIRVKDIEGRKIMVRSPKSGKEDKVIFMPETVANRLKAYIQMKGLEEQDKVFDLCYSTARKMINRLGNKLGIQLNPHDLRRHSATFASRNGVPLEIISKVLVPKTQNSPQHIALQSAGQRSYAPELWQNFCYRRTG